MCDVRALGEISVGIPTEKVLRRITENAHLRGSCSDLAWHHCQPAGISFRANGRLALFRMQGLSPSPQLLEGFQNIPDLLIDAELKVHFKSGIAIVECKVVLQCLGGDVFDGFHCNSLSYQ